MRVLVTGSAGFIGAHLANALVARGDSVLGVDSLIGGDNVVDGAQFAKLDLATDDLQAIVDFKPELVAHCACNAREGSSIYDIAAIVTANSLVTARLLEAVIKGGALKRFNYFSSMARYGAQQPPFEETLPAAGVDPYGISKAHCEQLVRIAAEVYGFAWSITLPHNCLGTLQSGRDPFRNLILLTANRILRGEPVVVFGDGKQRRAFSAIEDSLPCFVKMLDGVGDSQLVNIGGMQHTEVNEAVAWVKACMGVPNHPTVHEPDRVLEVKNAFSTYRKSVDLLGYRELVGWRESTRRACEWAKTLGPQEWKFVPLALRGPGFPRVWEPSYLTADRRSN